MSASAEAKSLIYHSADMLRIGICTLGWKSAAGKFPVALVTFVDSTGGQDRDHKVRPYARQTDGMRAAERFAETGEIDQQ